MSGPIVKRFQGQVAMDAGNIPGIDEMLNVRMSFETDEQGAVKIRFPFRATIIGLRSIVVKALGATDAGTITPANSVGNMANGTLSHAAAAALGDEDSATPTTNQIIAKDTDLTLTTAKTTDDGKVNVVVHYRRLA